MQFFLDNNSNKERYQVLYINYDVVNFLSLERKKRVILEVTKFCSLVFLCVDLFNDYVQIY